MYFRKSFFVLLFLALFVSYSDRVFAQGLQISVSKGIYALEVLPGVPYEDTIGVINTSASQPLPVEVQLSMWNLKSDVDELEFISVDEELNATKWFSLVSQTGSVGRLSGTRFIINPDGFRDLRFRILPPQSAPLGSYLVAMRLKVAAPDYYFAESGTRLYPEIDVLFFINVKDLNLSASSQRYTAQISSFSAKDDNSIGLLSLLVPKVSAGVFEDVVNEYIASITNTGLFYFKMKGSIEVKNMFGRVVKVIDLPSRYLIPNRTRTIPIGIESDSERSRGFFASVGQFLSDHFYFGPYTATLLLQVPLNSIDDLPDANSYVRESVRFWVFPWKLLLIFAVIIFAIRFFWRRGGRRA
jgi:hypothetical protein